LTDIGGEVNPDAALPEPAVMTCYIGGRGRCRWEETPLSIRAARALRRRLRAALKYLDSLLAEVEDDDDDDDDREAA
jgi:hypothetical protein